MKYLIKDLSRMTGVKGFTIRKWQERYKIFEPQIAPNGYWYYSNEDYIILSRIAHLINQGEKVSHVVSMGRDSLLQYQNSESYRDDEKEFFSCLTRNEMGRIEEKLNRIHRTVSFKKFVRFHLRNLVDLVGRGWNDGLLSVADEHAFSRWFFGYLSKLIVPISNTVEPVWLIASFPGDIHELGAYMHFALLNNRGISVRFVGTLPMEHIIKELNKSNYKAVSFSLALKQPMKKIERVKNLVPTKTKVKKVFFGGRGMKLSRQSVENEN